MQSFGNKREEKRSLFLEYEKWKGEHMDDELLSWGHCILCSFGSYPFDSYQTFVPLLVPQLAKCLPLAYKKYFLCKCHSSLVKQRIWVYDTADLKECASKTDQFGH